MKLTLVGFLLNVIALHQVAANLIQNCTTDNCDLKCPPPSLSNETCSQYCQTSSCTQHCARKTSCEQYCVKGGCEKMVCDILSHVPAPGKTRDNCHSECERDCPNMTCNNQATCMMKCNHDNCTMNCNGGECYVRCIGKGCQVNCRSVYCDVLCQKGYCRVRVGLYTKYPQIRCPGGYCYVLCPIGVRCNVQQCPYDTCVTDYVRDPFNINASSGLKCRNLAVFAFAVLAFLKVYL